jgi:monoamine oxidase
MPMTRRGLLNAMAKLGGAGAVYETLAVWDFLKPPPAMAAALSLPADAGRGKTVVILGAGVSGLCAAYELDRAGYDCVILEASRRLGGRSLTLRRGDSLQETGQPLQTCEFDEGLYLNAGPGRIPHHHTHVIHYCREFDVALQPYIFASRANLTYSGNIDPAKQPRQVRRYLYDLQGHVAELLDKCTNKAGLDQPLSAADLKSFRLMLERFGDLTPADKERTAPGTYRNATGRAGYSIPPGVANQPGKPLTPLALDEILRSELWNDYIFRDMNYEWQTSLMEPVGGMDMFVKGFARQPLARQLGSIEGLIRYGAKVTEIDNSSDNITIAFEDRGAARSLVADYCVSTIPMPIFKTLRTRGLDPAYMSAANNLPVTPAGKVGWQAERFWEREDEIYGGISWTTDDIQQIWYPSFGYLSRKGTLTGAYMYGDRAVRFNSLPLADRLEQARVQGEKLHPNYRRYVEKGVAVGWNNMEFEQMGWVNGDAAAFGPNARILAAPQGRFHMAGDQITYWTGWQEGAILSAHAAVRSIHQQTRG